MITETEIKMANAVARSMCSRLYSKHDVENFSQDLILYLLENADELIKVREKNSTGYMHRFMQKKLRTIMNDNRLLEHIKSKQVRDFIKNINEHIEHPNEVQQRLGEAWARLNPNKKAFLYDAYYIRMSIKEQALKTGQTLTGVKTKRWDEIDTLALLAGYSTVTNREVVCFPLDTESLTHVGDTLQLLSHGRVTP